VELVALPWSEVLGTLHQKERRAGIEQHGVAQAVGITKARLELRVPSERVLPAPK
jgi:hypothetical protein